MQKEIDEIWALLENPDKGNFATALSLFTKLVNNRTYRRYMSKITPLNARYEQHKEGWGVIINATDERSKIISDFTTILQEFENEYSSSNDGKDNINLDDPHLDILYKFDFKNQMQYFTAFTNNNKPINPLLVRAKGDYGQTWLYNRFIYEYRKKKQIHDPIVVDLQALGGDFGTMLYHLSDKFGVQKEYSNSGKDDAKKKSIIIDAIKNKISTQSQIVILKYALTSNYFTDFWNFFCAANTAITYNPNNGHKCLVLLIEDTTEYVCNDDYFIYAEQCTRIKVAQHEEFIILHLHDICPIDEDVFNNYRVDENMLSSWGCVDTAYSLEHECDNGNPMKVIHFICKKQNIDFNKYENLWLKY